MNPIQDYKIQLSYGLKLNPDNKVTERSMLVNLRSDNPSEVAAMVIDLRSRLGCDFEVKSEANAITFDSGELSYNGNPFDDRTKIIASATMTCPRCGKPMRRRSGARGEFYGCAGYPNCSHTQPI